MHDLDIILAKLILLIGVIIVTVWVFYGNR